MAEPFKILVNKKIPRMCNTVAKGEARQGYYFRESCAKILRNEVRNVVYVFPPNRLDLVHRMHTAARNYLRDKKLPLAIIKRNNYVFIVTEADAKEERSKHT